MSFMLHCAVLARHPFFCGCVLTSLTDQALSTSPERLVQCLQATTKQPVQKATAEDEAAEVGVSS